MLDKLKVAIVLVVIAAVSGFLIYQTNELTYEGIAANKLEKERGFYREIFGLEDDADITATVLDIDGDLKEEIVIEDADGNVIGYIYKGEETNNYGDITILVGVKVNGDISNVIISSSTNTPIYVKKIKDDFLEPFMSYSTDDVVYDSSTGASYTYGSVEKFVGAAADYFNTNRGAE
jgi:electron transport complex protein RnfG